MPKYAGKQWTKVGRGGQSPKQLTELGKLIEEKADGAITATLTSTGDPMTVVVEGESKAYRITPGGNVSRVDKPKGESDEAPVTEPAKK